MTSAHPPRDPLRPRAILETALYVSDVGRARRWYEEILGLEASSYDPPRHVFFRVGDGMLLLFNAEETSKPDSDLPPHGARGPAHTAFEAAPEEIEAWKVRLAEAGVAIEHETAWPGGGRSLYFRDPDGNLLEIATRTTWSGTGL